MRNYVIPLLIPRHRNEAVRVEGETETPAQPAILEHSLIIGGVVVEAGAEPVDMGLADGDGVVAKAVDQRVDVHVVSSEVLVEKNPDIDREANESLL